MKSELTQEKFKTLFHYCPRTGIFTRLQATSSNAPAGKMLNALDRMGYLCFKAGGKTYKAHRLAFLYMLGRFPADQVDHINHRKADNRWANLREVSQSGNQRNAPLRKDNTSGLPGVLRVKGQMRWRAHIRIKGKILWIYYGEDFFEACCARKKAETRYAFHPHHGHPGD